MYRLAPITEPNPDNWQTLVELLPNAGKPVDPDWTFAEFTDSVPVASGGVRGRGFSLATWRWNGLSTIHRATLRSFCPAPSLSARVYITTRINELDMYGVKIFADFMGDMIWTPGDEDIQDKTVLGFVIEFHNLVLVS